MCSLLSELTIYKLSLWLMVSIALIVFFVLLFISAPYGRHARAGWGVGVPARLGWLVMEAPSSLVMLVAWWWLGFDSVTSVFFLLWQIHYFHRAFIYPFTLRSNRLMPFTVVLMAVVFNMANATLNAWHFKLHADWYTLQWFYEPHFWLGLSLFMVGFVMTKRADSILSGLRGQSETPSGKSQYKIPHGFLYRYISCPNYLGESVQWLGWAIATLSPAGWVFFIWTLANLIPRALSHHRWYHETFSEYPSDRKAFLPFCL